MVVAHNLGYVARRQKDTLKALQFFRQSLQQAVERDHRRFVFFCLEGIASVFVDLAMYGDAAALFAFSDQLARENEYKLDPVDAKEVVESRAMLESNLTIEEYQTKTRHGQDLNYQDAISLAVGELQPAD